MRVHIENFQSLKDVTFDVKGFTVLVGRSNLGKSATIRAIEGALFNAPADAYVRDGASHLKVHLKSEDFDICWRKGGGHNDYEVDGVTYENVGREAPSIIRDKGFRDLEVNKNHLRVQVSDQFHPLFLLDCSGTDAAQAIADVHRIYEIQAAQDSVDKDRRAVRAEIKVREKDLTGAKDRALTLDRFEESVTRLRATHVRAQALAHTRERVTRMGECARAFERAHARVQASARVGDMHLPTLPQTRFREAMRDAQYASRIQRRLDSSREITIPTLPLRPNPNQKRDAQLARFLVQRLNVLKAAKDLSLPNLPDRTRVAAIQKDADAAKTLIARMTKLREEVLAWNAEISSLEEQIRDMVQHSTTCPLCGQTTPNTHQHT